MPTAAPPPTLQATLPADGTAVIVGAGQAGRWLVLTLRASGFGGRIVWFGAEAHAPYERPPLSKAVLKGEVTLAQLALIAPEPFAALQTDFRPALNIVAIDRSARTVTVSNGSTVGYDVLFLAHGGQARSVPGLAPHPRVLTLRSWEDALTLKAQLASARQVLVLGGGWIGLEVAASARLLGKAVTVLEAAPRLCIRTVPPCVSADLLALHQSQGVDVRLGDGVAAVHPADDGVTVQLNSGAALQGDVLVVGIGLVPHQALAQSAGIHCHNGVLTDSHGRSSDPHVYAVGDVANTLRDSGELQRIESWENAQRQAVAAAKTALGLPHDLQADGPPWFWSDQFDDNLQLLGTPTETMTLVERHNAEKRQRLYFFCEGTKVKALAAINGGREVKIVKKWIAQGRYPPLDMLASTESGTGPSDINKLPLAPAAAV